MFRLDLGSGLTGSQITKLVRAFQDDLNRFERLERYYNNKNAILNRHMDDGKPNNKLCHSFCKYITNMATGYFMGKGVRIVIEDQHQKGLFDQVVDDEYTKDITFEIAKEASKCGIAFELLYINEDSALKSRMFGAREFIPIYSQNIDEFLEGAVRLWTEADIFGSGLSSDYAALYTKSEIVTYRRASSNGEYIEISRECHMFSDVPVIIYQNNKEQKGDFEDVISLVDAYDKAQSDTANDFEYFTDAYLVLIGAGGGIETDIDSGDGDDSIDSERSRIRTLKRERILSLDEKGQAQWLIKNVNDVAVENYKERIKKDLFFLAQVPALTDESFGQNLSGVAIKYKLIGLEELSVIKENKFKASIKKKMKFITEFINLKHSVSFKANDIQIIFDRNVIENLTEIVENVNKLEGITSKATQLGLLPFVDNPNDEIVAILREQYEADNYQIIDIDSLSSIKKEVQ